MKTQLRGVSAIFTFIFFMGKSSLTLGNEGVREGRSVEGNLGSSYFFYEHPEYPKDCMDVFNQCSGHNASGVYVIKPDGYPDPFEVYCDNKIDGGGWTVIQRREDGSVDFDRQWKDYKEGFGFLSSEFWLGNKKLAILTNQKKYQLRLDLEASNGNYFVAYDVFRISDEWSNYKLVSIGEYSGTADESVTFCPTNMKYGNCSCQATCDNPQGCYDSCNEGEACVCADGFLKKGDECVPPQDCGCYVQGEGVLLRNTVYVNSDCTRRCNCTASGLSCDSVYRCDVNAVCEERDNVRQCYCNDGYTGDGQTCSMDSFTDCQDIYRTGEVSGIYTIQPINSPQPFEVYCDMSDGGGWTVFQRRIDGDVDFYLDWSDYRQGFGDRSDEFWLGNDNLYYLTNQDQGQKNYELRIDLVNKFGSPYYANYTLFRISDEDDLYRLVGLGTFSGTAGDDSLNYHRNRPFTTKDSDNDAASYNCAVRGHGAWWYGGCHTSNLNSNYHGNGIYWSGLPGGNNGIKFTEMKLRPT